MKKNLSKIVFIMLLIMFVCSTCMTVYALASLSATKSQDGLEVTLNFDKDEYKLNEKMNVTLNVKNNNSYVVNDVQTEIIVPSVVKLSTGNLETEQFSLDAGEDKIQKIILDKVDVTNEDFAVIENPNTGDNVGLYVAIMMLSLCGLLIIAVSCNWISKKSVILVLLSFLLTGTLTFISIVNANSKTKEILVEKIVKYDGEEIVIKGKVTYTYEVYNNVLVNDVDQGFYQQGDLVTIIAEEATEGKHFANWTVEKGNVVLNDTKSKTTTFIMGNEDVEIKANYEVNKYTIKVVSNEGGKVEGLTTVEYDGVSTFIITPDEDYNIKDVIIDGESKGIIASYVFENVKEEHKIEVVFEKKPLVCVDVNCASCDEESVVCTACIDGYSLNSLGFCELNNYTEEGGTCESCSDFED